MLDGKDLKKRSKLQYDDSLGVELVLDGGGWVFPTQNFDNLKANDQKKYVNQVVNSVADTAAKTEIMADCRCLPVHGIHAKHRCVTKSIQFVANKKAKAA